ncbi:Uncharacterised protein [Listeria grayi]|uniref:Uncharacterized protein n=1 Tax=Listeria grayi TaxID=1641 RepID=A0A378MPK7_LISGR|nr:Uncharacterised protein [Listeria grayi]
MENAEKMLHALEHEDIKKHKVILTKCCKMDQMKSSSF